MFYVMPAIDPDKIYIKGQYGNYVHPYEDMYDWCEENCKDKFYSHHMARWSFDEEEDALAFKLKWG